MNDFDQQLTFSTQCCPLNCEIINQIFHPASIDPIELKGKSANDIICIKEDGTTLAIECKNCTKLFATDISPELISNYESNSTGWPFKLITNKTDYILFTWHNIPNHPFLIIKAPEFEKWFRDNNTKYETITTKSNRGTFEWLGSFKKVPISDLPEELIYYKSQTFINRHI